MAKKISCVILFILIIFVECKKNPEISGTYKKIKGNYRYDTIVIEKKTQDEYSISAFDHEIKKLMTMGKIDNKTLDFGWVSSIIFNDDYKQFYINTDKESIFMKTSN
jgi:hypothetical protein